MSSYPQSLVDKARNSEKWEKRRLSIIELSHYSDAKLFSLFTSALDDPVSEVRHSAIIALSRLGDPRAVSLLAKPRYLQSKELNMRWATVRALGKLGDIHVIDTIVPLVDDEEWLIRNEVISILIDKTQEIVKRQDPSLARILIRMLSIDEPVITKIAVEGLINIEFACSSLLMDTMKNIHEQIRKNIIYILGETLDQRALPLLIDALNDPQRVVRKEAALALGKIKDASTLKYLIQHLTDQNDEVRQALINAIVQFGKQAFEPLQSELSHALDKTVRTSIINALGKLKDNNSIPILIEHLKSSYHIVRSETVLALSQFGPVVITPLIEQLYSAHSETQDLLKEASQKNGIVGKLRVIKALGDLEDYRATTILKELLSDSQAEIAITAQESLVKIGCAAWGRCGALQVIGNVADKSIIEKIKISLKDFSPHVRYEAIRAIGNLKGTETIDELIQMAKTDPIHEVRIEALRILRELSIGSEKLFSTALFVLDDKVSNIRLEATRILGDFTDDRAFEPLLEKLFDISWSVRLSAENAICNYGNKATQKLIKLLDKQKQEGKCRVVSALARIGDPNSIKPIEKLLSEPDIDERIVRISKTALAFLKGETGRTSIYMNYPLC